VRECTTSQIDAAVEQLGVAGYPIGWAWQNQSWLPGQPGQSLGWAVLGIVLTGVAVSLGSSFWFDLLGKFMNVRMTGKRENSGAEPTAAPSDGGKSL
jgi:hypothetical protein